MTSQEIKILLDKYFEGHTSLEEEDQLKQYFQGEQVDPSFAAFRPLFQYLDTERQASLSPSFEKQLLDQIREEKKPKERRIYIYMARIAAVAILIRGVVILFPRQTQTNGAVIIDWEQYEPQSEAEAIAEATAALELLAAKLNGSAKTATKELNQIEKAAKVFK